MLCPCAFALCPGCWLTLHSHSPPCVFVTFLESVCFCVSLASVSLRLCSSFLVSAPLFVLVGLYSSLWRHSSFRHAPPTKYSSSLPGVDGIRPLSSSAGWVPSPPFNLWWCGDPPRLQRQPLFSPLPTWTLQLGLLCGMRSLDKPRLQPEWQLQPSLIMGPWLFGLFQLMCPSPVLPACHSNLPLLQSCPAQRHDLSCSVKLADFPSLPTQPLQPGFLCGMLPFYRLQQQLERPWPPSHFMGP